MLRSTIIKGVGNLLEAQHVIVRPLARLHLGRSSNVVKVDFDLGAFLDLLHALLHFRSDFSIGTVDRESSLGPTCQAVSMRIPCHGVRMLLQNSRDLELVRC
jgi:hypothetical protein